jgi:signal transduction histidine kinase
VLRELWLQLSQVQDEERRRIARELHDSTGQKLAALSMTVGLLQDATTAPGGKPEKMFADCLAMIEQCAQEIRTLSYLLHPPLLDELGLAAAISDYVEGFSKRSGVQVALDVPPGLERLPAEVELVLFRVVQESLRNIHHHAGTATVRIRLTCDAEQVTLEVSDEGRGMSAETIRAIETGSGAAGVGIAGMRERLRLLGGRLEIKSGKCGTTVRAIIPRPQEPA